jgi:acyl carrier protein phosphodiesterase
MNYLAHAYLSFGNYEIMAGNLVADFVRGKQINDFPEIVREGIRIHRLIDHFTDHHPVNLQIKKLFEPSVGRYSGSFLDIAYDHFLSVDKISEPIEGWLAFSMNCYEQMDQILSVFPDRFLKLYHYMKTENWLYRYRETEFIRQSFHRLSLRAMYLPDDNQVFADFQSCYSDIQAAYLEFFPDLKEYVGGI